MEFDRTIVISGASSGIGRALALRLLASGHQVVGLSRSADRGGIDHPGFVPVALDLADWGLAPARLTSLAREYPQTSAVICNAGRGDFGSLEEFSVARIRALIDLNLTAQICLTRAFLPGLKRRESADLVLMGSEAALWGGRRGAVYSATKAGLRGFAQGLREECARSGVRVCIVNPGMVRTGFFDELAFQPGPEPEHALQPDEVAAAVQQVLEARPGVVFDEINLSPLKKVLQFGSRTRDGD